MTCNTKKDFCVIEWEKKSIWKKIIVRFRKPQQWRRGGLISPIYPLIHTGRSSSWETVRVTRDTVRTVRVKYERHNLQEHICEIHRLRARATARTPSDRAWSIFLSVDDRSWNSSRDVIVPPTNDRNRALAERRGNFVSRLSAVKSERAHYKETTEIPLRRERLGRGTADEKLVPTRTTR